MYKPTEQIAMFTQNIFYSFHYLIVIMTLHMRKAHGTLLHRFITANERKMLKSMIYVGEY